MFKNLKAWLGTKFSWELLHTIEQTNLIERQRYKLFLTFSLTCFLLCVAESFHALTFGLENQILSVGLQTFAAIFLINYLALQKHGKLRIAYTICLMTAFACVHLFNYYYGGIRNSGNFYYLFMIIATAILLGKRYGWAMLGLSVINQLYFYAISGDDTKVQNVLAAIPSDVNQDFLFSCGLAVIAIAALSNNLGSSKNIIIENLRESEKILEDKNKELKKLSLVASKTDNAVIISDPTFRITWVNEAFTQQTGYTLDEAIGRMPEDFLFGVHTDMDEIHAMRYKMRNKNSCNCELQQTRKDGTSFWTQLNVSAIMDEQHEVTAYVTLQENIDERKTDEIKIKNYLHELEITNKELDEFAYVVSHDLKAPLHAISNLTEWIEEDMEGRFSDDTKSNFNIIKSRVARMEDLINGLLEFARANHDKGERTVVDLNEYIYEVIDFCSPPPNCSIGVHGKLPTLYGDRIKFQQVFANLIGNAIKYNDKKEINISISATEQEDSWTISIRDNGPGIDPRFHEKIFVIFQTLNPRDTVESTGVGLAIVKKIVEEEGGKIWVDSMPGTGSDFRFTWPKNNKRETEDIFSTHATTKP